MSFLMKNIYHKVEFHPLFYFFAFLSVLTAHFSNFFSFMLVIFIHECGHLIFAFLFRWKIERVLFLPFGGMITFKEKLNRPIYQEFLILVGGPLFQILLYYIYPTPYHYPLLLFNLLPIYPLDGSKFLFLFSNVLFSYYSSYFILVFFSYLTVIIILIFYPSLYFLLLGSYLLFQSIQLLKKVTQYFLLFLFERKEREYPYYRKKIIVGRNVKKMKRSVKHFFFYQNTFHGEKEELEKYFSSTK